MGYDHDRIKANARKFYQLNKGSAIVVILIYIGISFGSSLVSMIIPGLGAIAVSIFLILPLALCLLSWFQRAIHINNLEPGAIFDPLKADYMGIVSVTALKYFYTWAWSLLFVIPGIIKTYSYCMTEYIKAENPNIPAGRAIELSMIMTDGYKGKLFYLDLSFIGWYMLSSFTFGILAVVYVIPYYMSARAFAYEELKANAINSGRISAYELNPNLSNNGDY